MLTAGFNTQKASGRACKLHVTCIWMIPALRFTYTQYLLVRHLPVSTPGTLILCSKAQQDSTLKRSVLLIHQLDFLFEH